MSKKPQPQTLQPQNLYQNCNILGPDGLLLCRASRKKLNWYLKMGLATPVSDEPFTIQLTFEPKGIGARDDPFGLSDKDNRCVVCGCEDDLTKHHVIPYTFRRHFPEALKGHQSHDVLTVCMSCHGAYEPLAQKLHHALCAEYGVVAPPPQELDPDFHVWGLCFALVTHGHKMPPARKEELLRRIAAIKGPGYDYVARAAEARDVYRPKCESFSTYGKALVTSKDVDLRDFSKRWRRHFVETMNPQYLPDHWDPDREFNEEDWKMATEPRMCQNCFQGALAPSTIERDEEHEGVKMHLTLPAQKCMVCAEVWLDNATAQAEIDQICHFLGRENGTRLRLRRERAGLTMDDLVSQAGIERAILSDYENSRCVPTAEHFELLDTLIRRNRNNGAAQAPGDGTPVDPSPA